MKLKIAATGALSLALFLGACSSGTDDTASSPEPAASSSSAPMAPSTSASKAPSSPKSSSTAPMASGDIVDTAVAAGDFTTLAAALTAAGLVDTLKGPGPFTVFAPTDAAFAALPAGTVDELLKDPTGQLTQILTYHVVSGEVLAADVVGLDGQQVTTVQGGTFTVEIADGKVVLVDAAGNRVNVVTTDVMATNGVIHVIDGVLMPA